MLATLALGFAAAISRIDRQRVLAPLHRRRERIDDRKHDRLVAAVQNFLGEDGPAPAEDENAREEHPHNRAPRL